MNDTRLQQSATLLDDARTLLADVADEMPTCDHYHALINARIAINNAILHVQSVTAS